MQRLSSWLVVLLALGVFAAAGYVVTKKDPVPDAGTVPAGVGVSAGLNSPDPTSSTDASQDGKVVAFLGDDWTSGVGATSKAKRFTTLLATRLGLREKNFGADGVGYAKSSGDSGAYSTKVDDVVAAQPDIVIVAGGRNDINDYLPTLRSRVKALFAELHDKLPAARIIAVAPMWGDSDAPAELDPVAAAVKQYVTAAGGSYLDLPDPIHKHPEYMTDDTDPDDQGYAAIADALAPKIRALLT